MATVAVVSQLTPADLGRATPCAGWTLANLLAHMTVQNHGFAIAAEGGGADPTVWEVGSLGADPVAGYAAATEHVLTAFAADGVLERRFALPEISAEVAFPAATAIGFHFIDCVVHGWDVARSLGIGYELDAHLLQLALPIAEAVPDGSVRLQPGAAFRPRLPANDAAFRPGSPANGAATLDRILLLLGRSPDWPD